MPGIETLEQANVLGSLADEVGPVILDVPLDVRQDQELVAGVVNVGMGVWIHLLLA